MVKLPLALLHTIIALCNTSSQYKIIQVNRAIYESSKHLLFTYVELKLPSQLERFREYVARAETCSESEGP